MKDSSILFLEQLSAPFENEKHFENLLKANHDGDNLEKNSFFNLLVNHAEEINVSYENINLKEDKLNIFFPSIGWSEVSNPLAHSYNNTAIEVDPYTILKEEFTETRPYRLVSDNAGTTITIYPKQKVIIFSKPRKFLQLINDDYSLTTVLAFIISKLFPFIKISDENLKAKVLEAKEIAKIKRNNLKNFLDTMLEKESALVQAKADQIKLEYEDIENKLERIELLKEEIRKIETSMIFGKDRAEKDKTLNKLLQLSEKYEVIKKVEVKKVDGTNQFQLIIRTNPIKVVKYDRKFIDEKIDNLFNDNPRFKEAFIKAHKDEADMFFSAYKIKIQKRNAIEVELIANNSAYQNPHASINCLGSYRVELQRLKDKKDIIGIIRYLIEYLQAVNFHDIGLSNLPNSVYIQNKEGEVIYNG